MLVRILRYVALMAVGFGAACVSLYFAQKDLIYVPSKDAGPPSDFALSGTVPEWLSVSDGTSLQFWRSSGHVGKPFVIYFHGNAGNLEDRQSVFRMFESMGIGFAALDYRGYGNSGGTPSYEAIMSDALAFMDRLRRDGSFERRPVLVYGESLGTAVATRVAAQVAVDGIVLQSPYTSVKEAASSKLPFIPISLLLSEPFSNVPEISMVHAPLLVIHGAADELFPPRMAQAVFEASGAVMKTMKILAWRGHNDIGAFDIEPILQSFVADVLRSRMSADR